ASWVVDFCGAQSAAAGTPQPVRRDALELEAIEKRKSAKYMPAIDELLAGDAADGPGDRSNGERRPDGDRSGSSHQEDRSPTHRRREPGPIDLAALHPVLTVRARRRARARGGPRTPTGPRAPG